MPQRNGQCRNQEELPVMVPRFPPDLHKGRGSDFCADLALRLAGPQN